jgi:hypothetical protein
LVEPLALRLRPGTSNGVVLPTLYVDNDWVDGRALTRDEQGELLPATSLLVEVQTLLRHGLQMEMLPHEMRRAQKASA